MPMRRPTPASQARRSRTPGGGRVGGLSRGAALFVAAAGCAPTTIATGVAGAAVGTAVGVASTVGDVVSTGASVASGVGDVVATGAGFAYDAATLGAEAAFSVAATAASGAQSAGEAFGSAAAAPGAGPVPGAAAAADAGFAPAGSAGQGAAAPFELGAAAAASAAQAPSGDGTADADGSPGFRLVADAGEAAESCLKSMFDMRGAAALLDAAGFDVFPADDPDAQDEEARRGDVAVTLNAPLGLCLVAADDLGLLAAKALTERALSRVVGEQAELAAITLTGLSCSSSEVLAPGGFVRIDLVSRDADAACDAESPVAIMITAGEALT